MAKSTARAELAEATNMVRALSHEAAELAIRVGGAGHRTEEELLLDAVGALDLASFNLRAVLEPQGEGLRQAKRKQRHEASPCMRQNLEGGATALQAAQGRMFEDAMFKAGRRAFSALRALESGDLEVAKQDMIAIEGLAMGTRPR
jgi:hypothetical protein